VRGTAHGTWSLVAAAFAPLLATSEACPTPHHFEIVLRPKGDALSRTLTVRRSPGTKTWLWIAGAGVRACARWQDWSAAPSQAEGPLQYGDGAGGNLLGCAPFAPGSLAKKIILVDRGRCPVSVKVSNVASGGGLAAIVAEREPPDPVGEPPNFVYGGGDPSIGGYTVTRADGRALKKVVGKVARIDPAIATGGPVDPALVDRLKTLYREAEPEKPVGPASAWTFSGTFSSETPSDIGGAGRFLVLRTSLGSVSAWAERVRGNPDQTARLRALESAAPLFENIGGWLEWRLGDHPNARLLREFVSSRVRDDFVNLLLISWAAEGALNRPTALRDPSEGPARMLFFLSERGYFAPADAPHLAVAVRRTTEDERAPDLMAFAQRIVAGALGLKPGEPLPEALDCLGDFTRARASFATYLVERANGRTADPETSLTPEEALGWWSDHLPPDLLRSMLPLRIKIFGGEDDLLSVRLALRARPLGTSGTWDARHKVVEWRDVPLDISEEGLPMFLYAWWADPETAFQREHLGWVALRGETLADYVVWRVSLDAGRGDEWDTFLDGLTPGRDLEEQIEAFRFRDEGAEAEEARSNLAYGPSLIRKVLHKKSPRADLLGP